MNKIDSIVKLVVNSFVESMKNRHMSGLVLDSSYEPLEEVCQFFDGEKIGAYGCFHFELEDHKIFVYNTYGDEDQPEHYDDVKEVILSMGFCFYLDGFMYSFDLSPEGTVIRSVKSKERYSGPPELFAGKRAFYYYRDSNFLSMKTFDADFKIPEHFEARNWTSGPRTRFELEKYAIL